MLLNEVLHKAKESGEDFIVMKVDTIKAFDYMSWEFLVRLLQRIGVGPTFINMVKTNTSTASPILI